MRCLKYIDMNVVLLTVTSVTLLQDNCPIVVTMNGRSHEEKWTRNGKNGRNGAQNGTETVNGTVKR